MPEITLNDEFGRAIAETIKRCRIQSMIEIGSWDGTGSTAVIVSALKDASSPRLVCVEADTQRHEDLRRLVSSVPWIATVCRPSVSRAAMTPQTFEDVWHDRHNRLAYPEHEVRRWWNEMPLADEAGYLETLTDETWDAALIDGGEFQGYDDFRLLRDRVQVLMLDDVFAAYKCNRAHWELGHDRLWECIWCSAFVRNGAAIWRRIG